MDTRTLETAEKHLLRSRMLFALGLFILFLAICGFLAAQAVEGEGIVRYAWLAGVILLMVACLGFGRIALRLGGDLRRGEKRVRVLKVMGKEEKKGRKYLVMEGKTYQVGEGMYAEMQRGDKVELHMGSGGFVFGLYPEETV